MLPKNKKTGGSVGRAMPGVGDLPGIVRAGDFHAMAAPLAVIAFAGCALMFNASELWPALFVP